MIHAFQWDLARQVERLDWLLAQLPRYAEWGYRELYLHLEDAVDYPSLPGVARSDAYSWSEFEQLVDRARDCGIGVVPIVNLLGHTQYLIKTPEWRDLNELRADDGSPLERGQICPLHPRTREVAERLLHDVAPLCTAGKVHVGLDESFHLGRHPLSRAEIAEVGLPAHFARYVGRLHALATSHRLRLGLWADMLVFIPEAIPQLPSDVIAYDWYYYPFRRHPRMELYNFREYDLATPLQARGIEYWGCPMNGAFRFEPMPVFGERLANAQSWWRRCNQVGAGGFLVTSWEAYRLAIELTTAVDAAIACLWLNPGLDGQTAMLAEGFARTGGKAGRGQPGKRPMARNKSATLAARAALACDDHAFTGYARWEVNERWDVVSTRAGISRYTAEAQRHARLAVRPGLPSALVASILFRRYLAERDVFIRRAAKGVWRLRRLLSGIDAPEAASAGRAKPPGEPLLVSRLGRKPEVPGQAAFPDLANPLEQLRTEAAVFAVALRAGRRAARAMWRRTRDAHQFSQNEAILAADAARLAAWRQWLRRCARDADHPWTSSPVAGAWQLQFTVINVAPASQRVVVEQQQAAGTWRELRGRHTIEFRAPVARPRTNVQREFVAAIDDPVKPLRIALRGIGDVLIAQVELTDGVTTRRPTDWPRAHRLRLGRPAPTSGFPQFHATENVDAVELSFSDRSLFSAMRPRLSNGRASG
jgi:hypothetical protein